MTPLFLACLLAVLPVVSMRSPIFGPQEMSRVEGSSASIKCYYPATSVNRHSRKFWCRQGARGRCTTLISDSFISKDYEGRANITDFPESNMFVVDIGHLTQSDSGLYKCGVGIINQGLFFDVNLEVRPDPGPLNDAEVYIGDLDRTVTINCPFTSANANERKSLCKKLRVNEKEFCVQIVDSIGFVNPDDKDRISLIVQHSQLMFSVVIKQLKLSDAGIYSCKTGEKPKGDIHDVDLQVQQPELLYGDLRGSVTFDCAAGPEMNKVPKFLCRVNNEKTCEVVINSLGKRAKAYEGRILLISKNNGLFSVHITGLRKEDAGSYQCGADSDGEPQRGPVQTWQLFVNEETTFPRSPSVVKGVVGGSVTMLCPYKPKDRNSLKYWCRWDKQTGTCSQLVSNERLVTHKEEYEGRLALYEEPGNGTYTVMLNQLTTQDAGFYWCLTNGDARWWSTVELQIVEGEPDLKVPENTVARVGETLKLPCHSPCKFFSYEKYWCKWSTEGCQALPSQHEDPRKASVTCEQNKQIINLILNPVTKEDEGWYWCGVKEGLRLGETVAVHVEVKEKAKASQDVSQGHAAPGEEVIEPRGRGAENRVVQVPKLWAEEKAVDTGDPAGGSQVSADASSSTQQGGSSTVLVSTLVPLALVLAVGAVAIGVVRARHRRNVDRVSIGSYRTDISMSDFENSRDFGANDNMGATPVTQETSLGGKDEITATTEDTVEIKEPKTAKRSSKEEADMAYGAFLLQANNMATSIQGGHSEA
ncbi:polymeric immunoglobulin receptor [Saccopteryx leptura]|uniref:polymeric immunoglobulin receptor n=1 Tax=Saccopteryx leptura TaxID=249018 RepID=UPI00339C7827